MAEMLEQVYETPVTPVTPKTSEQAITRKLCRGLFCKRIFKCLKKDGNLNSISKDDWTLHHNMGVIKDPFESDGVTIKRDICVILDVGHIILHNVNETPEQKAERQSQRVRLLLEKSLDKLSREVVSNLVDLGVILDTRKHRNNFDPRCSLNSHLLDNCPIVIIGGNKQYNGYNQQYFVIDNGKFKLLDNFDPLFTIFPTTPCWQKQIFLTDK